MQAYAEGYELLAAKDIVTDVHGCFKAWTRGTVVRSWLLDLLVKALEEDPELAAIKGYVDDSGEGRWTVEEAIANSVPMPVITAALFARFASRQDDSPAMKAVAALRNQFGGHAVTAATRGALEQTFRDQLLRRRCGAPGRRASHPPVADRLPLLRHGRARARARGDGAGRAQRPGQDQPGRGDRLRRDPGQSPGAERRRRWFVWVPSGLWCALRSPARAVPPLVELEIVPGTANRARINRSPVPRAREVLGMLRTVLFAPEDLSLVKGDPDGRRRVPRRPAGGPGPPFRRRAGRRRTGATPAQRPAQVGRCHDPFGPWRRAHPRCVGRPSRHGWRRAAGRPAAAGAAALPAGECGLRQGRLGG